MIINFEAKIKKNDDVRIKQTIKNSGQEDTQRQFFVAVAAKLRQTTFRQLFKRPYVNWQQIAFME